MMRPSLSSGTRMSSAMGGGSVGTPAMGRCATTSTVWSGHGRDPRLNPVGVTAPCPSSSSLRPVDTWRNAPSTNMVRGSSQQPNQGHCKTGRIGDTGSPQSARREGICGNVRGTTQGHGLTSRVGEYRPASLHSAMQVTSNAVSAPSSLTAPPATSTPRNTISTVTAGSGERCLTPPGISGNYGVSGSTGAWRTPPQRNHESPPVGGRFAGDAVESKLGQGSSAYTPPARSFRSLMAPTPPALPQGGSSPAGPAPALPEDPDSRQKRSLTPPMASTASKRELCAGYSPGPSKESAKRESGPSQGSGSGPGGRSGRVEVTRGGPPYGRSGGRGITPRGQATPRAITPPNTQQASRAQAKVTPRAGGTRNGRWGRGRRADENEAASSKEPAHKVEAVPDERANDHSRSSPGASHRESQPSSRRGPLIERHLPSEQPSELKENTVSAIPPSKVCKLEKENRALERVVGELKQKHEREVGELKQKLQEMEKMIRESTTCSSKADDVGDQAPKPTVAPSSGNARVNLGTPEGPSQASEDAKVNPGMSAARASQEIRRPVSQPPLRSSPPVFSTRSKEAVPARSASQQPSTATARATEMPPSPQTKPPPGTWSSGEFERGLAKTAPVEVFELVKNVVVDMIQGSSCCTPPCASLGPPACGTPRNSLGEVRIDQMASPLRRTPRGTTSKAPSRQSLGQTPRGTPRSSLAAGTKVIQATRVPNQEPGTQWLREKPEPLKVKQRVDTAMISSNLLCGDSSLAKSKSELHDALNSSIVERESCNVHDGWLEPEDNVLDDLSKILQADTPEPKVPLGNSRSLSLSRTPEPKVALGNSLDESYMGNSVDESFHGRDFGVPDLPQPKLGDVNLAASSNPYASGMRPVLRAVPVGSSICTGTPASSGMPVATGSSYDLGTPPHGTVFFPAPPTNPSARVYHKGHHQSWSQRSRSNSNHRPS
mmetsp:Transcript_15792/g.29158  ORF Transcript_15792/g.29158 Transcript_15792/m.29158 type:complete len:947 (-) Transcript_15792:73-2913(-)